MYIKGCTVKLKSYFIYKKLHIIFQVAIGTFLPFQYLGVIVYQSVHLPDNSLGGLDMMQIRPSLADSQGQVMTDAKNMDSVRVLFFPESI